METKLFNFKIIKDIYIYIYDIEIVYSLGTLEHWQTTTHHSFLLSFTLWITTLSPIYRNSVFSKQIFVCNFNSN